MPVVPTRRDTCTVEGLRFAPLPWATRATNGAPGQICTDTARGLSPSPLRWATGASWYRVKDLHPQPSHSERDASAVGLTRPSKDQLRIHGCRTNARSERLTTSTSSLGRSSLTHCAKASPV